MSTESQGKIRIKVQAYDHKLLDQSVKQIVDTVRRNGAKVLGPIPLPTRKKRWTVLKSTFVYKNSRDQYEIRTHARLLELLEASVKTVESMSKLSLPAGVDISIKML